MKIEDIKIEDRLMEIAKECSRCWRFWEFPGYAGVAYDLETAAMTIRELRQRLDALEQFKIAFSSVVAEDMKRQEESPWRPATIVMTKPCDLNEDEINMEAYARDCDVPDIDRPVAMKVVDFTWYGLEGKPDA